MKTCWTEYLLLCLLFVTMETRRENGMRRGIFMTSKRYHALLKNIAAINEDINTRNSRSHKDIAHGQHWKSASSNFYNPIDLMVHGDVNCPSKKDIMTRRSFSVCPAYCVTEYDANRIPAIIFQVHCKCLSCHVPNHGHSCTPMFKFINAYRVVNKTHSGENIYDKVREPVSYSCKCRRNGIGSSGTYIPP